MSKKTETPRSRTKEDKRREWLVFLDTLRRLPPDRLSKAARWALENEGRKSTASYDIRAVMK